MIESNLFNIQYVATKITNDKNLATIQQIDTYRVNRPQRNENNIRERERELTQWKDCVHLGHFPLV